MSVRQGRAVLGNAAGALSDTHRGTHRTQLSHTKGNEPVVGSTVVNVFREVWENDPHCRRIFVSISQLPVCQALTSPSAHGHQAEQRKWFNEVKPREEFFHCSFACLVTSPLSSSHLSLPWDCSGQEVKGYHFSSGWCLVCCCCTSCLSLLQRWCLPGFGMKIERAWWLEYVCVSHWGGWRVSKQAGLTPSTFLLPLYAQRVGLISLCRDTAREEGGKACRQTVTHWQAPEASSQLTPSRTDWCCKARELISIKDIMLEGP